MSSAGLTEIQQKQVSGLVDVASGLNALSGDLNAIGATFASNLQTTGLYLENNLLITGATLEAADVVISGQADVNTSNLAATGATLASGISGLFEWSTGLALTGDILHSFIAATGEFLKVRQNQLTGEVVTQSGRLDKISGFLGNIYEPNGWFQRRDPPGLGGPFGTPWLRGVSGKVDDLSGYLRATGQIMSGLLFESGNIWYTWTTGLEGGLRETGRCIGARLGGNSLSASALGNVSGYIGTGVGGRTAPQLYEIQLRAEAAIVQRELAVFNIWGDRLVTPVDLCSTRILQWRGVVPESAIYESDGKAAGAFRRERLFLAGDESFGPYYQYPANHAGAQMVYGREIYMARVPRGSQWSVELIGHARKYGAFDDEVGGSFFLNTGFIIGCDPLSTPWTNRDGFHAPATVSNPFFSGIYGISGADGLGGAPYMGATSWSDGLGYSFGISGFHYEPGRPPFEGYDDPDGYRDMWLDVWAKNYTNYSAEFQVTAYVTALAPFNNEYTRPWPFH